MRIAVATRSARGGLGPYVPAIDADGRVACTVEGGRAALVVEPNGATRRVDAGATIVSHPVLLPDGGVAAFVGDPPRLWTESLGPGPRAGSLGPTVAADGGLALRAPGDRDALLTRAAPGWPTRDASLRAAAVHGLPVALVGGAALVRADLGDGRSGVYEVRPDGPLAHLEVGGEVADLARFPAAHPDGGAVIVAAAPGGSAAIVHARDGGARPLLTAPPGTTLRGAVLAGPGRLVWYATPRGGALGIYAGPPGDAIRIVGLGDPVDGARVVDLALNPASAAPGGRLAIRVTLSSGADLVLRVDDAPAWA